MGKVGVRQETTKSWKKVEWGRCLEKRGRQEKNTGYIRTECIIKEQRNGKQEKLQIKEKY